MNYTVNYRKCYDNDGTLYNQEIKLKLSQEQLDLLNKDVKNYYGIYYYPIKTGNNFLTLSMLRIVANYFNLNTSILNNRPIMLNRNTVLTITI